jgi:hypothetical protein
LFRQNGYCGQKAKKGKSAFAVSSGNDDKKGMLSPLPASLMDNSSSFALEALDVKARIVVAG